MEHEEWKQEMELLTLRQDVIDSRLIHTSNKMMEAQSKLISSLEHAIIFLPIDISRELKDSIEETMEITIDFGEILMGFGELIQELAILSTDNLDKYKEDFENLAKKLES